MFFNPVKFFKSNNVNFHNYEFILLAVHQLLSSTKLLHTVSQKLRISDFQLQYFVKRAIFCLLVTNKLSSSNNYFSPTLK